MKTTLPVYPFSALVGQDSMQLALQLNAVNPAIGGVLIRGEKGTAKSTAARGLASLLPPLDDTTLSMDIRGSHGVETIPLSFLPPGSSAPFINLPLGASDDRVVGTLNIEAALQHGERQFEPGLLAQAHRGILYVDEVNLLADHLVDVLLDSAASGINTIEREGISVTHPARFIIIGTMNPEEGDLRPQLLDRFGLVVEATSPADPTIRAEVVRHRIAFEANPDQFIAKHADDEAALSQRIIEAQARLPSVTLSNGMLELITHICAHSAVDGLRADITMYKTAQTIAAWEGRESVSVDDVRKAAEFVLPHRRRRQPFEEPGLDERQLDDMIAEHQAGQGRSEQKSRGIETLGGKEEGERSDDNAEGE